MKLFKYFHPDRTDVLRDANIRYSSPASLNDPFELKPHILAVAENMFDNSNSNLISSNVLIKNHAEKMVELRNYIKEKILKKEMSEVQSSMVFEYLKYSNERVVSAIQTSMETAFNENIGILCLSETPDNLLMWSHYAHSHQGFVVEFDAMNPYFQNDLNRFKKVAYTENRLNTNLTNFDEIDPFFTKGKEWNYENEWRVIDYLNNANTILHVEANAIHLFEFPKSIVKSIIFGCKLSDSKKYEIREILNNTPEYSDVICLQADIHKSKYELVFEVAP